MSVLQRSALQASPLADLHALASELAIDGYRRLRREQLIDAILERQGQDQGRSRAEGGAVASAGAVSAEASEQATLAEPPAEGAVSSAQMAEPARADGPEGVRDRAAQPQEPAPGGRVGEEAPPRRRRRRGGRLRTRSAETDAREAEEGAEAEAEEEIVEGEVELLPNGSGFLRVEGPEPSDRDLYISPAQVKRCELISGDRVSGPRRPPRRSERFGSLARIDTINGRPASELVGGARWEDLPAEFPRERFRLAAEDPTVKAIEGFTPFGRGSRVAIVGPARAGKSEALRRLLEALCADPELHCSLVLAGVRPEEITLWEQGSCKPLAAVSFAASAEARAHAVELAVDQGRRIAMRGGHALVAIDTLDGLPPAAAREALAAARCVAERGSLTLLGTASAPIGGETTVIALDLALASSGRFPALDLAASGTIRAELLVGEAGADLIYRTRAEALNEP
jgi:transcription termination factor Rho